MERQSKEQIKNEGSVRFNDKNIEIIIRNITKQYDLILQYIIFARYN